MRNWTPLSLSRGVGVHPSYRPGEYSVAGTEIRQVYGRVSAIRLGQHISSIRKPVK